MEERNYGTLLVDLDEATGVLTLTMNRPERKNALNPQLVNELLWALDDAKESAAVRVIVLTGAGSSFCAGGDLKQMSSGGPQLEKKGEYDDLLGRFPGLGKPTIAKVAGYAMGGGLGLVASCDFAIAAESAVLGTPEIKRGLFPMMIMAVLQRVMSRRDLMNMMLLGERLDAAEGKRLGLLSHVVTEEQLDDEARSMAKRLASQSPTAMRMGLLAFHHQADRQLEEALPYLREQLFALLATADAKEGLMAFFQKRDPVWTGK